MGYYLKIAGPNIKKKNKTSKISIEKFNVKYNIVTFDDLKALIIRKFLKNKINPDDFTIFVSIDRDDYMHLEWFTSDKLVIPIKILCLTNTKATPMINYEYRLTFADQKLE